MDNRDFYVRLRKLVGQQVVVQTTVVNEDGDPACFAGRLTFIDRSGLTLVEEDATGLRQQFHHVWINCVTVVTHAA